MPISTGTPSVWRDFLDIENAANNIKTKRNACEKRISARNTKLEQFSELRRQSQNRLINSVENKRRESLKRNTKFVNSFSDNKPIIDQHVANIATQGSLNAAKAAYQCQLSVSLPTFIHSQTITAKFKQDLIDKARDAEERKKRGLIERRKEEKSFHKAQMNAIRSYSNSNSSSANVSVSTAAESATLNSSSASTVIRTMFSGKSPSNNMHASSASVSTVADSTSGYSYSHSSIYDSGVDADADADVDINNTHNNSSHLFVYSDSNRGNNSSDSSSSSSSSISSSNNIPYSTTTRDNASLKVKNNASNGDLQASTDNSTSTGSSVTVSPNAKSSDSSSSSSSSSNSSGNSFSSRLTLHIDSSSSPSIKQSQSQEQTHATTVNKTGNAALLESSLYFIASSPVANLTVGAGSAHKRSAGSRDASPSAANRGVTSYTNEIHDNNYNDVNNNTFNNSSDDNNSNQAPGVLFRYAQPSSKSAIKVSEGSMNAAAANAANPMQAIGASPARAHVGSPLGREIDRGGGDVSSISMSMLINPSVSVAGDGGGAGGGAGGRVGGGAGNSANKDGMNSATKNKSLNVSSSSRAAPTFDITALMDDSDCEIEDEDGYTPAVAPSIVDLDETMKIEKKKKEDKEDMRLAASGGTVTSQNKENKIRQ